MTQPFQFRVIKKNFPIFFPPYTAKPTHVSETRPLSPAHRHPGPSTSEKARIPAHWARRPPSSSTEAGAFQAAVIEEPREETETAPAARATSPDIAGADGPAGEPPSPSRSTASAIRRRLALRGRSCSTPPPPPCRGSPLLFLVPMQRFLLVLQRRWCAAVEFGMGMVRSDERVV